MKILTFKYTKSDGSESSRVLALSAAPTKLYAGTDITSLEAPEQVMYAQDMQAAKDAYLKAIKSINDNYDLNFNYRQFSLEKMKEIIEEDI
jgi:hypothetical protein